MRKLASLITCICLIFSTTACSQSKNYSSGNWSNKKVVASNNYVTKDIKVDNFKKISVAGSPDVTFTQKSGRPGVEVYTSDNIIDLLDIKVRITPYISVSRRTSMYLIKNWMYAYPLKC